MIRSQWVNVTLWSARWGGPLFLLFLIGAFLTAISGAGQVMTWLLLIVFPLVPPLVALPRYFCTRLELHDDKVVVVNPGGSAEEMTAAEMDRIDRSRVPVGTYLLMYVNHETAELVGKDGRRIQVQALLGSTKRATTRNRRALLYWAERHGIPCVLGEVSAPTSTALDLGRGGPLPLRRRVSDRGRRRRGRHLGG